MIKRFAGRHGHGGSSIERGSSRSHMNPDETGVREVKE